MIINKKLIQSKGKCWFVKKMCTDFFLLLKLCKSTNYGVSNDYTKPVMTLCSFLQEYYHKTLIIISAGVPRNDGRGKDGWGEQGPALVRSSISSLTLFTIASIWCNKKQTAF